MKQLIRKVLGSVLPRSIFGIGQGYLTIRRKNRNFNLIDALTHGKLVLPKSSIYYMDDYARQFYKITKAIHIDTESWYLYPFDSKVLRGVLRSLICSMTVDFGKVLESDLNEIKGTLTHVKDKSFEKRELLIIDSIEALSLRITAKLKKQQNERTNTLLSFFPMTLYRKPLTLDEAIQKILFYDALFWQMEHYHIGLGRLDYILNEYYVQDIERGIISEAEAKEMLRKFLLTIGKDTIAKSNSLVGDTGQYILLGGVDAKGYNIDNHLTELFLELMTELKIPDPKLILRVNNNTSKNVWTKAIQCITTGIGSPLIMDETSIMNKMVEFGYSEADVWNMGTSACWEPLIIGKSFDQNNPFRSAVALAPLNKLIMSNHDYTAFDDFYNAYKDAFKEELKRVVVNIDFDCSPLFTLFFDDCITREKDFTDGGAIYSNHGAQIVSFPNTINALLNIKSFVFEKKLFSLNDCKKALESNFEGMEDILKLLKDSNSKFGSVSEEVLNLTNDLIAYTDSVVNNLKCNGERIKVGFSSPSYIGESKCFPASMDGRRKGDPFAVHISPISSKIDISEILEFSSLLKYGKNCVNGNVVDFILPSSYIKQQDKLMHVLKDVCDRGTFELQLNVLDKSTLIDAKAHPEKYPDLIVRVWGFSAYFNDLPVEFKDNLIQRAEIYEAA